MHATFFEKYWGSQRVNRYAPKNRRSGQLAFGSPGKLISKPVCDSQTGFLYHPSGFPLEIRRKWFTAKPGTVSTPQQFPHIGIIFASDRYLKPGTMVEITVHMPNNLEKFTGQVVLVKHNRDHYEIGLWLSDPADAGRARIVEQVCHIEAYLKEKKYRDGPYNLNPERVAREWIAKYAGGVPTL
jgi:hypothetical protein